MTQSSLGTLGSEPASAIEEALTSQDHVDLNSDFVSQHIVDTFSAEPYRRVVREALEAMSRDEQHGRVLRQAGLQIPSIQLDLDL